MNDSSNPIDCLSLGSCICLPLFALPRQVGGVPLTSLLVADDQEQLPTGQCRPRVPPTPINLRGDAYLSLQKVLADAKVRKIYCSKKKGAPRGMVAPYNFRCIFTFRCPNFWCTRTALPSYRICDRVCLPFPLSSVGFYVHQFDQVISRPCQDSSPTFIKKKYHLSRATNSSFSKLTGSSFCCL